MILGFISLGLCSSAAGAASQAVDLTKAVVVTAGSTADAVERQAALMLRWEVRKRTGLELKEVAGLPADATPAIVLGSRERMPALPSGLELPKPPMKGGKPAAEGYVLLVDVKSRPGPTVCCVGNDHRGTLFAVGKLLRSVEWAEGSLQAPTDLSIASAPEYPVRGMQLGYRRLNDTLDAWDVGRYAQYIRDLIIFGNNSVELIPPSGPGVEWIAIPDPLMPLNTWDMTVALTALLDAYDMDVWLWLPLEDNATDDPHRRAATLLDREELFAACKRIDHVFVPAAYQTRRKDRSVRDTGRVVTLKPILTRDSRAALQSQKDGVQVGRNGEPSKPAELHGSSHGRPARRACVHGRPRAGEGIKLCGTFVAG